MRSKGFIVCCLILLLIAACSSQSNTQNTSSVQTGPPSEPAAAPASNPDFNAEPTSAVSVMLSWAPIDGAEQYALDLSFGGDYFTVAVLDAGQTSFEDFPVPDNTGLSYRLQAYSGADVLEEYTLSVVTPAIQPDPLVLELEEFEPVSPLANLQIPTIDPNNPSYDPNDYVIPGFNPETGEIDMDALMGEPVAMSADIGPEGGTVAVTSPDNVTYTLLIPPGALEDITTITLTPIGAIDGLPLETFLGAVRIDPAGLLLEAPAFLSYTFPEEVTAPEGMVTMNFAFDGQYGEFYFVPYFDGDPSSIAVSPGGAKTAKPGTQPFHAGPLSGLAIQQFEPAGVGQGSAKQVRNTIKANPPTSTSAQKSNQAAGAQMEDDLAPLVLIPNDDLAPLIPVEITKMAYGIGAKVSAATTARELAAAVKEFETYIYLYNNNAAMKEFNNRIWDQVVDKTKKVFEDNKTMCLTENAFVAQAIGRKLQSPVGIFWKTFASKFKAKHGDQLLKDLAELIKKCKFQIILSSDITLKAEESGTLFKTNAAIKTSFPLKINLDPLGEPVLTGKGNLTYQRKPTLTSDSCSPKTTKLNINGLSSTSMEILALRPLWKDNGELKDFSLDVYAFSGKQNEGSFNCKDEYGNPVSASGKTLGGRSGDLWGGLFVSAHFPNEQLIRDWKISGAVGPGVGSSGLLAEKIYTKVNQRSYFGGDIDETTTFQIEKLAGKP